MPGQLGTKAPQRDGSANVDVSMPADAGVLSTDGQGAVDAPRSMATAIAVGGRHACALMNDGTVRCWGDNRFGQLGDGTTVPRNVPVKVQGLTAPVQAIAAGDAHTCALDATGSVLCWGSNASGQLGDGSIDGSTEGQRVLPAPVMLADTAVSIGAGGATTCAATTSGAAYCWGANVSGQLGDGSNTDRSAPSPTVGVIGGVATGKIALAPGGDHTCVIAKDGSVVCSGDDTNGALGNGQNDSTTTYVASGIAGGAVAVGASLGDSCALIDDGSVQCWGFGGSGELGNGSTDPTNTPGPVTGLTGVTGIAVGLHHACAISAVGVSCWGDNANGDLGDGTTVLRSTPVVVTGLAGQTIVAVAAGGGTCALTNGGAVYCWGANDAGQVGDGTTMVRSSPVLVTNLQ
jgi:alpha-tubulin suppressor-like RCC1 family protein